MASMNSLRERFLGTGTFSIRRFACSYTFYAFRRLLAVEMPYAPKRHITVTVNIFTVVLNKWIYEKTDFRFPLTLTMCHMAACAILGFFFLRVLKTLPETPITMEQRLTRILPMSLIFIFNIILGNVSLAYVPVSFMQTIKSSVPFFTYFIQMFVMGKPFHAATCLSLVPVVTGVALATYTEVNFNVVGFMCALIASVTTAVQSIVGSKLLTGKLKMDSVNLVFNMAPLAFLSLVPFWYYHEYEILAMQPEIFTNDLIGQLLISSVVAFALNFAVFYAIKHTSALSFTVAGNFKVILVIFISTSIFKNAVTVLNLVGICTTILGCWLYNGIQYRLRQEAQHKSSDKESPSKR